MVATLVQHKLTFRPEASAQCTADPSCVRGVLCESLSVTPDLYDACMSGDGEGDASASQTVGGSGRRKYPRGAKRPFEAKC